MTTEKHDPWALLAEIHELQPWLSQDADLAARVEAALAERQDKPPCSCGQPYPCMKGCPDCCHSQGYLDYCQGDRHAERQDSAQKAVEWQMTNSPIGTMHAYLDGIDLRVRWDGQDAAWDATRYGRCATEAEAKTAALAAAKGMR
jgi:hypothetical protein